MSSTVRPRTPMLERVIEVDAHEGPVYFADEDALYFTSLPTPDQPAAIKRLQLDGARFGLEPETVSVVVADANGMAPDGHGGPPDARRGARSMEGECRGRRVASI